MIKAIFFAIFDVKEGPKIYHQVPPNSVQYGPGSSTTPLLDFATLSSFLIPLPALTNQPLQLVTSSKPYHRILSHPITLTGEHYPRNAFTFNCCLVLEEATGFHTYLPVAQKLANLFKGLEEQERFVSRELAQHSPNEGRIYAICELLLEDLNNYSECMIPIDGTTSTLNIKLFPIYTPPPPLYAWQVPLLTVRLEHMVDESWDLTMCRVLKHIDGVNSVKKISQLADADFKLVRKAIRHLLYYGCVTLLDVFSFSAIYAPTQSIAEFVNDPAVQSECLQYVVTADDGKSESGHQRQASHEGEHGDTDLHEPDNDNSNSTQTSSLITAHRLSELYLSLRQGQSVKSWVMQHFTPLETAQIDVRRFITFGVIKRFVYRVHKYAIIISPTTGRIVNAQHAYGQSSKSTKKALSFRPKGGKGTARIVVSDHSSDAVKHVEPHEGVQGRDYGYEEEEQDDEGEDDAREMHKLGRYLDGTHSFDEICTDLEISERELVSRLRGWEGGFVQIICR